jgi:twitching motility protein PilT
MLDRCLIAGGSDLHVQPGGPPRVRVDGDLVDLTEDHWDTSTTMAFCKALCNDRQWSEVETAGTTDFGITHANGQRFRVSVMRQQMGFGAVLRAIPSRFLTFEEIGLPEDVVIELLERPRGLILVTGPTGSGKSTTLATMVDWINTNHARHIITIEDPVEFRHAHKQSMVTQREVGTDVPGFSEAMRRAMRQDPDVLLVGEMRDVETMAAAVTAAETGHLVLATLHTTGSAKTIHRIVDAFPGDQQSQIRVQLALSLLAVISQVLVPTSGRRTWDWDEPVPSRVAALELMIMVPSIANVIRSNEISKINDVMQTSRERGMFTLDSHLAALVKERLIGREEALAFAQDQLNLDRMLG